MYLLIILLVVLNARSTRSASLSAAAWWRTLKIFFQPDLILPGLELTICVTQWMIISRMTGDRLVFMIYSKGRRKSFWKRK